jgi:hypothetical protein
MSASFIVNGVLTIIGLITVATIIANLVTHILSNIFHKMSVKPMNNYCQNRQTNVNVPNYIKEQGNVIPQLINKGYISITQLTSDTDNTNGNKLPNNPFYIIYRPLYKLITAIFNKPYHSHKCITSKCKPLTKRELNHNTNSVRATTWRWRPRPPPS